MSLSGTPFQSAYPDEFSDSMANLTASIVQEQLAPILQTLREHAKLLDLHAALLNHSTAMNRYNVSKLDDIRDFQTNINYKLQFYVDPEDRVYPTYRNPPALVPLQRVKTLPNIESRLPETASGPTDESSADPSTTTTSASAVSQQQQQQQQDPPQPSSPATTQRAPSPPPSPQFTGEGFSVVVPGPSRRLQRERPFGVQPDPMWNSTRSINPFLRLAAPPPPPPYVEPPAYAATTIEDTTAYAADADAESQAATATLTAQHATPPPSVPRPDPEPNGEGSAGPSTSTDTSTDTDVADDNNAPRTPSSSTPPPHSSVVMTAAAGAAASVASEGDDDDDPPEAVQSQSQSSQLSEKARGKKRMREEEEEEEDCSSPDDDSPDDDDDDDPFSAARGSGSGSDSRRDGPNHHHKRRKTDGDTGGINTDRLDLSPCGWRTNSTGFMDNLFTLPERRRNSEKLKSIGRMYRDSQWTRR